MFGFLVVFSFGIGCAACDPKQQVRESVAKKNAELIDMAGQQACEGAGGEFLGGCPNAPQACVARYSDAGRQCTDSSQCDGLCLTEASEAPFSFSDSKTPNFPAEGSKVVGRCQTSSFHCGSIQQVESGKALAVSPPE
jgi:hypothetical protein